MLYREIKPPAVLSDFVKLIWIQEFEPAEKVVPPERIVADGIVEIVFHFGQPFLTYHADNTIEIQPTGFAIAQLNRHILIQPTGKTGILAVRFYPWGAYHFFDFPVREFTERPVSLEYIWQSEGTAIQEKIGLAKDNDERLRIITGFLIEQLSRYHKSQYMADKVLRFIQKSKGLLSVRDLVEATGLGERNLERICRSTIGISPKQFSRITRFLNTCRFIKQHRNKTITQITYECGYYDQAHLTNEFKRFAGITPKEFFASPNTSFYDLE